jgi:hypothetical protein
LPSRQHIFSDKTNSNRLRLFSDRQSPKGTACLAIGCRKIASERLAIQHGQIASNYVAIFDCQITIAYLAIKKHKIAESI